MPETKHWWFYTPTRVAAFDRDPAYYAHNCWTALCGELIAVQHGNVHVQPHKVTCDACILLKFQENSTCG